MPEALVQPKASPHCTQELGHDQVGEGVDHVADGLTTPKVVAVLQLAAGGGPRRGQLRSDELAETNGGQCVDQLGQGHLSTFKAKSAISV